MELIKLVKKAQAGDAQAVQEVCLRFTRLVKKYAFQSHIRGIADEAEGQGWLAVMQCIRQYDEGVGAPFAGYVERHVQYAVWNLFKRERRRWQSEVQLAPAPDDEMLTLLEQLPATTDVALEVEQSVIAQQLRTFIALLPAKQQQVITSNLLEGNSLTEIAGQLQITTQGVYNLRQRGIARLKVLCAGMYRDIRH